MQQQKLWLLLRLNPHTHINHRRFLIMPTKGLVRLSKWNFPGGWVVMNPSAKQETQVWAPSREDPLE